MRSGSPRVLFPAPVRVRWVVAFTDLDVRGTGLRRALAWLTPGFRHCWAFREVAGGVLVVQMTVARLQVDYLEGETEALYAAAQVEQGATLVVVEADIDDAVHVPRGTSCVTIVRALAGMRGRIQTPLGLARSLSGRETQAFTWSNLRRRLLWVVAANRRPSEKVTRSETPGS